MASRQGSNMSRLDLSVQESEGQQRSTSAIKRDRARMVGELLLAFIAEILADSLSIHSMTLRL